jgi:hypothetical protein
LRINYAALAGESAGLELKPSGTRQPAAREKVNRQIIPAISRNGWNGSSQVVGYFKGRACRQKKGRACRQKNDTGAGRQLNLGSRKKWLWTGITRASLTATDLIQLGVRKRDQRGRSAPLLMLDVGIVAH